MDGDRLRALWHELTATREPPEESQGSGAGRRRIARWVEAGAILAAGNLSTGLSWVFRYPINSGPFAIALAGGLVGYVLLREGPDERRALLRSAWPPQSRAAALAVVGGLALAAPSLLGLWIASTHGQLPYSDIQGLTGGALVVRLLIEIPLLTALPEELVFRQYLLQRFPAATPARTLLLNAAIFTLWHLVVQARTALDAWPGQPPLLVVGSYFGGLAGIFAGGAVFGFVRIKTGSFAYSALAHWLAVGLITLGTWRLSHP
jgi:membrane protease YdiL (CAAX protease family)